MTKKIVFIGPESTGKSTITQALADYFNVPYVNEYARYYLNNLDRTYLENDLVTIAKGQLEQEEIALRSNPKMLFCDTDLRVIQIWSEFKYGRCHEFILDNIAQRSYHLYFLCGIDTIWEFDSQREHPHLRQELFDIYKVHLQNANVPFIELWGKHEERLKRCIEILS